MNISIRGTPAHLTHKEVVQALDFYANLLLSKKIKNNIDLEVHFDYKLGCEGVCEWTDSNHRPKDFLITIKGNLTRRKTLLSLAHEMVHVKQYATGILKEMITKKGNNKIVRWYDSYINIDQVHYYDQPWEIDAHGREIGLYARYLETLGPLKNENEESR